MNLPSESSASTSPAPSASCMQRVAGALQLITGPWTKRNFLGWFFLIAAIVFIKSCVVDQYSIPTGSMEPTLHGVPNLFQGDRVLVNKWIYGPRIPFTQFRLCYWAKPKRWDIVVFRAPESAGPHPILVKRVVGLPGETVHIAEGKILINGSPVTPPPDLEKVLHYTTEFAFSDTDVEKLFLELAQKNQPLEILNPRNETARQLYTDMARWHERIAPLELASLSPEEMHALCDGVDKVSLGVVRQILDLNNDVLRYGVLAQPEYAQVPADHYFVLGDNSPHSSDGRVWGWLPRENFLGRVFAVWFPWRNRKDFTGFSHTWWGRLLLYGLPLLFVLWEIRHSVRAARLRKTANQEKKATFKG